MIYKFAETIVYIILFSVLAFACISENKSQDFEDKQIVNFEKVEVLPQNGDSAFVYEDVENVVREDIVLDVWKAYLKSEYCDIQIDNFETTFALINKKSNSVASIELDGSNRPYVREKISDSEEEEFYEETVLETFACYPLKKGGHLVLWYYDATDWGRKIFAVFKFDNNVLTRQKNAFPPFESDFIDKNPSFDWDELVKLSGTEVVYFMQDCWACKFDADGFTMSLGGMEETVYKFNGSGFVKGN